jgi:exopolyphosphatase/guanosine-5'-triphosphate,3'-diphosphate pyrophosphatase
MRVYDSARVDGAVVTAADLQATLERLAALPLAQRKQVVGLDPGRAPVMVAGLIILQEVLRAFNLTQFTVSESDILQGILLTH